LVFSQKISISLSEFLTASLFCSPLHTIYRTTRRTYGQRKTLIEPVIGVLKEQRGMRQFLRRGLAAVHCEWLLVAISYNLTRYQRLLA
jgi:hypothetical protein